MAWLVALLMVPLMLFICALDTKRKKLKGIEVEFGAGKRLREFMELVQLLLGGDIFLIKCFYKLKGLDPFA